MNTTTTTNNNNFICGLQLMCLTPEEEEYPYSFEASDNNYDNDDDADDVMNHVYNDNAHIQWLDDSECQENLATILPLNPEVCMIDSDNHIQPMDGVHLFFEELGYFCQEPEPIDPTRDYDAEFIQERDDKKKATFANERQRRHHIDLDEYHPLDVKENKKGQSMPSLDDTNSGLSSTSSSIYHEETCPHLQQQQQHNQTTAFIHDLRSPLNHHGLYANTKMTAYAYAPHVVRTLL
ncbi:hypothetical protein BDF20DRAFT_902110 [Mycotypha africana]|uniref:uncharacterized protein n=1 Tax=Mycotypha africana TaxID=64632 RepID=UPI0023014DF9|nr:uncharacterized protein BDF20DRAFT_902110 [Mycotypha africana]KAI8967164.1 hypothetical protein BDF20DRAFT_902110 [Mycotypha africana]